jgi:hypothetical protein
MDNQTYVDDNSSTLSSGGGAFILYNFNTRRSTVKSIGLSTLKPVTAHPILHRPKNDEPQFTVEIDDGRPVTAID